MCLQIFDQESPPNLCWRVKAAFSYLCDLMLDLSFIFMFWYVQTEGLHCRDSSGSLQKQVPREVPLQGRAYLTEGGERRWQLLWAPELPLLKKVPEKGVRHRLQTDLLERATWLIHVSKGEGKREAVGRWVQA